MFSLPLPLLITDTSRYFTTYYIFFFFFFCRPLLTPFELDAAAIHIMPRRAATILFIQRVAETRDKTIAKLLFTLRLMRQQCIRLRLVIDTVFRRCHLLRHSFDAFAAAYVAGLFLPFFAARRTPHIIRARYYYVVWRY